MCIEIVSFNPILSIVGSQKRVILSRLRERAFGRRPDRTLLGVVEITEVAGSYWALLTGPPP